MKKVSFIVLGAGSRGNTYSDYALANPDKMEIVGVAEPVDVRRNTFKERHNVPEENVVKDWRELLGDKVAIIAGIETNNYAATVNTPEQSKAYTAAFYAEGADGIYYNNHEYDSVRNRGAWAISYDNCRLGHREFTVTLQDCIANETLKRYKPLPVEFDGSVVIPLKVGPIKSSDKVTVAANFIGDEYPTLTAGSVKNVKAVRVESLIRKLRDGTDHVVTPDIPLTYDICGVETASPLELKFQGKGKITYITILIDSE